MVSRISRLYGQKFNSDINSGLTNIANTFKPPSMTDIYLAQKMRDAQTTALAHKALQDKFAAGETPGVADFYGAGIAPTDYEKYNTERAMNEAARTGDYTKLDPYIAAQKGFGSTAAASLTKDIPAGNTFIAPASIAGMYGMRVPAPAADAAQPDGAATETDSKGQPSATGAFTFTAPAKNDKSTSDAVVADYLTKNPAAVPAFVAGKASKPGFEPAVDQEYGKSVGGIIADINSKGAAAPALLADIQTFRNALASGKGHLTFGPGSDWIQSFKQAYGSLAGEFPPGTAEADVMKNLGYKFATAATKEISSRPAQMEFLRALDVKEGLGMSEPGINALLNIREQQARANQDLAQLYTNPDARKNWLKTQQDYFEQNPLKSPFNPAKPLSAEDAMAINATQGPAAAPVAAPAAAPIQVTPELLKADPKTLSTEQLQAVVNAKRQAAPTLPPAGTPGVDIGPAIVPVSPLDYMRGGG